MSQFDMSWRDVNKPPPKRNKFADWLQSKFLRACIWMMECERDSGRGTMNRARLRQLSVDITRMRGDLHRLEIHREYCS